MNGIIYLFKVGSKPRSFLTGLTLWVDVLRTEPYHFLYVERMIRNNYDKNLPLGELNIRKAQSYVNKKDRRIKLSWVKT